MHAEKIIIETDQAGIIKNLPKLPPNKQLEAIFLIIDDIKSPKNIRRSPHPDIAGKVEIFGDVFNSVKEVDWNLSS